MDTEYQEAKMLTAPLSDEYLFCLRYIEWFIIGILSETDYSITRECEITGITRDSAHDSHELTRYSNL